MDLAHAILGLLSWKPLSGYDLKRIISDSEVFYWSGNNNQIYKNLIELEKGGMVSHQVYYQDSLPAKKVYSVTGAGLSELRRSLRADPQMPEVHKNFLIQLAWAELLPDEEVLGLLEKYAAEVELRLRMHQELARRSDDSPQRSPREKYLWRRIAENLVAAAQTELDWARQTQQDLRSRNFEAG